MSENSRKPSRGCQIGPSVNWKPVPIWRTGAQRSMRSAKPGRTATCVVMTNPLANPVGRAALHAARLRFSHRKPVARWQALHHRAGNGHVHSAGDLSAADLRGLVVYRQQEFRTGQQLLDRGLLLALGDAVIAGRAWL